MGDGRGDLGKRERKVRGRGGGADRQIELRL